ncbi:MAG TPA: two-component regulator propeller domain-containing protein [Cellvibrionaceae bacterium]
MKHHFRVQWRLTYLRYFWIFPAVIFQIVYCSQAIAKPNLRFEHLLENFSGITQQPGMLPFIVRDHNGIMWFAGEKVYRYDGVELRSYAPRQQVMCVGFIRGMVEDRNDTLWIATESGLCSFDASQDAFKPLQINSMPDLGLKSATSINVNSRNEIYVGMSNKVAIINSARTAVQYFETPLKEKFSADNNEFQYLFFESDDAVWIGSSESGLIRFSPSTGSFEHFMNTAENPHLLPSNDVRSIVKDRKGNIWFGMHQGGISRLDPARKIFKHYLDEANHYGINQYIWHLIVDQDGQLWIGSDGSGLTGYDDQTDSFFHYQHDANDPDSIASNKTIFLFEDPDKNLWASLYPSGIDLVDRRRAVIQTYRHNPAENTSLNASGILSVVSDSQKQIWIGTEQGLNLFDPIKNTFENYSKLAPSHWNISASPITVLEESVDGNLWIGTWGDGLYLVNTQTQAVTHFEARKNDPNTVDVAHIWAVLPDENETWFGSEGDKGILIFDHQTKSFRRDTFKSGNLQIASNHIYALLKDTHGNRWVATLGGLYKIAPNNKLTLHSSWQSQDHKSIPTFRIRTLFQDSRGRIWIGSEDQGAFIYDAQTGLFRTIEHAEELLSTNVTRILEAKDGKIWLFTANGLAKVEPESLTFSVFNNAHGLISSNFNRGAGFITADNTVYAGGATGLSVFNADAVGSRTSSFPVHITNFKLFNQDLEIGKNNSPLEQSVLNTQHISLAYNQNSFTFSFAALSYPLSYWNQYAYKLVNFEDDWNYVGSRTTATYTNIPAGHFTFQVKAKNSDGNWSDQIDSIELFVKPPPWKTGWAYCLYMAVFLSIIRLAIRYKTRQLEHQKERELSFEIVRLNQEKDEMRRNFIADISHELKTPLSILSGELEAISDGIRPLSIQSLSSFDAEVRTLNKLVDDLFDLSLADLSKLKFTFQSVDVRESLERALFNIDQKYISKDIFITKQITSDALIINADPLRINQLFTNLIENAFRYTDAPGKILLTTVNTDDAIIVEISDSKPGVQKQNLENLFQRFYREEPSRNRASGGAGLGLSICRHIVEAHNATIIATESSLGGVCIRVTFQKAGENVGFN